MKTLIPLEVIEQRILLIRGQKVMLSTHLAELYDVKIRVLNQAVKRNISRFPEDFMFHLNTYEAEQLVSQNVIPHKKYFGGSLPYAFIEQGVAMFSSMLNSERAIKVNIQSWEHQKARPAPNAHLKNRLLLHCRNNWGGVTSRRSSLWMTVLNVTSMRRCKNKL